jgi:hypothetical protein
MRRKVVAVSLLFVLALGVLAPSLAGRASAAAPAAPLAGAARTHVQLFDKTRFLLHAGAAYFAFHHWVWTPFKSGKFSSGVSGRTKNIVKAGLATLFTYHELKVAYGIANTSNSGLLKTLVKPLNALMASAQALGTKLKSGDLNPADLTNFSNATGAFSKLAGGAGAQIKDIPVTIPGVS